MIQTAINTARGAGAFLLEHFGSVKEINAKGDRDFATEIDRGAEKIIVEEIKRKYPAHGILAEENERTNLDNEWLWIIDPLDGTHNYIRNIDIFGVSIGVLHRGEFVIGVIYMPKEDGLYVAERGAGAYRNDKRIKVSANNALGACSVSFDSSIRYKPGRMSRVLADVACEVFNVRMFGSSARILSYVAEGKLDFAIEFHDKPWDFAGGVCIIREAGGDFTDLAGNLPTSKTIGYVASNKTVHFQVLNKFFPQSQ